MEFLLKKKSSTYALIIICRNFSEQKFLKTETDTFFMVVLMVDSQLKLQIDIVD